MRLGESDRLVSQALVRTTLPKVTLDCTRLLLIGVCETNRNSDIHIALLLWGRHCSHSSARRVSVKVQRSAEFSDVSA